MSWIFRPIRKGELYQNAIGHTVEAPGDGAIFHCDFLSAEQMVESLAVLGWKCRKRKGSDDADRRPDVLG